LSISKKEFTLQRAFTRLDDEVVAKIEQTGKSVYQFLQEAAIQKLQKDEADNHIKKLQSIVVGLHESYQENLVSTASLVRSMLEEFLKSETDRDEDFKKKMNVAVTDIFSKINSLKKD
jgi:hypothetical protein